MLFSSDAAGMMETPQPLGGCHLPELTGKEPPYLVWLRKLTRIIITAC